MKSGCLYSFSYTKEDSQRIFNQFHAGDDLWCKDEITEIAKQIATTDCLSSDAIRLASRMFDDKISLTKRTASLRRLGFKMISRRKQPWADVRLPMSDEEWMAFQQKILKREMTMGNKHYSCLSTREIGMNMIFNYLYGCVDCPQEYDSGMSFMEDTEHSVFGIVSNKTHAPLVPDVKDKKIHAAWYEKGNEFLRTRSFKMSDTFKPQLKRVSKRI